MDSKECPSKHPRLDSGSTVTPLLQNPAKTPITNQQLSRSASANQQSLGSTSADRRARSFTLNASSFRETPVLQGVKKDSSLSENPFRSGSHGLTSDTGRDYSKQLPNRQLFSLYSSKQSLESPPVQGNVSGNLGGSGSTKAYSVPGSRSSFVTSSSQLTGSAARLSGGNWTTSGPSCSSNLSILCSNSAAGRVSNIRSTAGQLTSRHFVGVASRREASRSTTPLVASQSSRNCTSAPTQNRASSSASTSHHATDGGDRDTEGMDTSDIRSIGNLHNMSDVSMSSDNQVYLGVMWQSGKLGVAYYDIDTTQIYMMLDSIETEDFKLLSRVLKQVRPTHVVVSSKSDDRLLKSLKTMMNGDDSEDRPRDLQFLPSIDFSLEICKRRLLSLDLPSMPAHFIDSEKTLFMSSLVPFENTCMVRATGGLLKYLEKMRVGIELEESGTRIPVLDLKIFSLDNQMILDDTAYSALQIFQRESHPSVYKTGTNNSGKEGLSLFGIMNRCRSQIGSRLLRLWFLRPLKDLEALTQRHDAVAFFVKQRNMEVVTTLQDCMKNMKNITFDNVEVLMHSDKKNMKRILTRMVQAQASVGDWMALYKTAYHATYIGDVCRAQPRTIEIFKRISLTFGEQLHRISALINKIVDFEESTTQRRFVVRPHVDEELDEKKRTFNGLPDLMTKVAADELTDLSDDIEECNVLYLPQLGYMLAIPQDYVQSEDYQIEGLQFMFLSNNMLHYKTARTRDLDRKLGDTQCEIHDVEIMIMHNLQNAVLEQSKLLLTVLDLAAELDCLLALATCAREFGYIRPTMTQESVIDVKAGRHPIQEVCCSPFVPNDTISNEEQGRLKVLTGPNASGKSVYLKQVALIVYLAHTGSFVPAESATIGLTDRIFTRIRSLESVSVGLSTFMIDVNQMSEALRSATDRSLVIVDEFGKGTDMVDGLSLLCSCLSHWVKLESCPHVFVSTHFHSMIHQHLLPKSPVIKYMTMETLHNEDELVFLYQLTEGHTKCSYAGQVATQAGLPPAIVHRGNEVSELIRQNKPIYRADSPSTEIQFNRSSTTVDRFLELDLEKDDLKSFLKDFVLPTYNEKLK